MATRGGGNVKVMPVFEFNVLRVLTPFIFLRNSGLIPSLSMFKEEARYWWIACLGLSRES